MEYWSDGALRKESGQHSNTPSLHECYAFGAKSLMISLALSAREIILYL
jgi:hypothetical protein